MQTELTLPKIYFWGSAECGQFLAYDEDGEENTEVVRPYYVDYFTKNGLIVVQVSCGGMHTLFLTSQGRVYSCGCNDDGVLGRSEEHDTRLPGLVDLPPVDMICCGDAHSVAANSFGTAYYWGFYRNTNGPMGEKVNTPREIGSFKGGIQKILSGNNHSLILTSGKVSISYEPLDTNALGRLSKTRNKLASSLRFQQLGERNIVDVFCGGNAAFIKRQKKDHFEYYAWGLNNYGQLGLGHTENTFIPTQIIALHGKDIVDMVGGEHHTLALDKEGVIYAFGRNDDGQLGVGEAVNEKLKVLAMEEKKERQQFEEQKKNKRKSKKNATDSQLGEIQQTEKVFGFEYVTSPMKVEKLANVKAIYAAQFYSFALTGDEKVYSWGLGLNYVLATRKDDSLFEPKEVTPVFKGERILKLGLGGQHAMAVTTTDPAYASPAIDRDLLKVSNHGKHQALTQSQKHKEQKEQKENGSSKLKKDAPIEIEDFSRSIKKD